MQHRHLAANALVLLASAAVPLSAQTVDDLHIQVHGYVSQGFLYSNHNSWNTTDSEDGSAAWNEAVVNVSAQPEPRLRVGVQARYFLLGDFGDRITLDWAQADFKVNEHFGVRVGKVKSPVGLLNESQDIDPAQLWALLPQSIYPLPSRDSILSHYGGVAYGNIPLGKQVGKVEYRAFGGERKLNSDDGFFQPFRDQGITVPNGLSGKTYGGTLRWITPLPGLLFGASNNSEQLQGELLASGQLPGTFTVPRIRQTFYFTQYEHKRVMVAGEYSRLAVLSTTQFTGGPSISGRADRRAFYAMASYRFLEKLAGGLYYSSYIDLMVPQSSARYQKDWALTARYDFNTFLYAKFEQHFIDGTALGYSRSDNPTLQPDSRLTLVKVGVSF